MSFEMALVVGSLAFGGGMVAGLLGAGGGVTMVPLLLYVPQMLGMGALDVKTVAALTIVQGFFASTSGLISHRNAGNVDKRIALGGGGLVLAGSLAGGVLSKWAPEVILLALIGLVTLAAAAAMLLPGDREAGAAVESEFHLRRLWPLSLLSVQGVLGGMVGLGGGFMAVPILYGMVNVPIRVAIGSSLALGWFGTIGGFMGKLVTHQVPLWLSVAVALGAVPGAQVGARLTRRVSGSHLRYLLVGLLVIISVRIWLEVVARVGLV